MKLKDGHTYITRTGLKRIVTQVANVGERVYPFHAKTGHRGEVESYTENGRLLFGAKTPYDFVKEFKGAK